MVEGVFSNGYVSFSNTGAAGMIYHTAAAEQDAESDKQQRSWTCLMGLKNTMDRDDVIRGVVCEEGDVLWVRLIDKQ